MTPVDEMPERTAAGDCIDCRAWTRDGRVVGEVHGNSGGGETLVRCAACCAAPRRKIADPTDPRTYSL